MVSQLPLAQLELQTICSVIARTVCHATKDFTQTSILFDERQQRLVTPHDKYRLQHTALGVLPGIYGPPADPRSPITTVSTFSHNTLTFNNNRTLNHGTVYLTSQDKKSQYAITVPIVPCGSLRIYKATAQKKWQLMSIAW